MAELPSNQQIKDVRPDVLEFVGKDSTLKDYAERALAYVKRDLEDVRGIEWSQIYNQEIPIVDYLTPRNTDKMNHAIALRAVALVFHDYAVSASDGAQWWDLGNSFRADYDTFLDRAKLDIDLDESGTIEEGEELQTPARFWVQ